MRCQEGGSSKGQRQLEQMAREKLTDVRHIESFWTGRLMSKYQDGQYGALTYCFFRLLLLCYQFLCRWKMSVKKELL